MPTPMITLKQLKISFTSVEGKRLLAVDDMNLTVYEHEFVALIGPSGCGKTTTLNAMAGLVKPDCGEMTRHGKPISGIGEGVGYISQADTLLPWRTVLDNVALGLELRGRSKKIRYEKARALLAQMGLSEFEHSYPHELSGGMKKRVTIARVLAVDPTLLFMDEPFGPLDAFTKERLQDDILSIWEQSNQTVVYVTHDLTEAIAMADRVVLISGRPGHVVREYPVTLKRPRRVMEVKFEPEFVALERRLWTDLNREVVDYL